MISSPLSLPVITIQHNYPEVIQEVQEGIIPFDKFWVSCYKKAEISIHAKVQAELDEANRDLIVLKTIEGDVEISTDQSGVSDDPSFTFGAFSDGE